MVDLIKDTEELIAARREEVYEHYNSAKATNNRLYLEGDIRGTSEYIYSNQKEDALNIVDIFYKTKCRVISIQKKTKVGADGLMIEILKLMTTHVDDNFVINPSNTRIITGMSNVSWEQDMKNKTPEIFRNKIFHHGKLSKSLTLIKNVKNVKNSIIIIDEIDCGSKDNQVLHKILKDAGFLDAKRMVEDNNKFVFISATMIKELYDLYKWGDLHQLYKMNIPREYYGHTDFLENGFIKEFFQISSAKICDKWIKEDIIENYGNDYRVHLIRCNNASIEFIKKSCKDLNIGFKIHTSDKRISDKDINELFINPISNHIILAVKGFFRRANLIPNLWKIRIGATHEYHSKIIDNNVQIQGLPGRMSGYWRTIIESGHKTGPHRTSIEAIREYEKTYNDPFALNSYNTSGFTMNKGVVHSKYTMLNPKNIANLKQEEEIVNIKEDLLRIEGPFIKFEDCFNKGLSLGIIKHKKIKDREPNELGYYMVNICGNKRVLSNQDFLDTSRVTSGMGVTSKWCIRPCYEDIKDKTTLQWYFIHNP
jgi:hypothetical protein